MIDERVSQWLDYGATAGTNVDAMRTREFPVWPQRFNGRVAVVTGAATGIGMLSLRRLGREGATVIGLDRDGDNLGLVIDELKSEGQACDGIVADLTDIASLKRSTQTIVTNHGRIDLLVNSGGISEHVAWDEMTEAEWDRMLDIDLKGLYFMTQAVATEMVKSGFGRIVNVSSGAGKAGRVTNVHYAAAKAGVISVTRSLALTLAKHGITVNAICPGGVLTGMPQYLAADWERRFGEPRASRTRDASGIGGALHPEEPVGLIAFLLSEEASSINGQAINIDSGTNMLS